MTGDELTLPVVGEIYWVDRELFDIDPTDRKPRRPAVVLQAPRDRLGRLVLVKRTSQPGEVGIEHPADPSIGCNKEGIFSKRYWGSIEAVQFVEPRATYAGLLPEPYLSNVIDMWQSL